MTQKKSNFKKDISVFDLCEAVSEVLDIMEEKKKMKNIDLLTSYENFTGYLIKTDKIRLQ